MSSGLSIGLLMYKKKKDKEEKEKKEKEEEEKKEKDKNNSITSTPPVPTFPVIPAEPEQRSIGFWENWIKYAANKTLAEANTNIHEQIDKLKLNKTFMTHCSYGFLTLLKLPCPFCIFDTAFDPTVLNGYNATDGKNNVFINSTPSYFHVQAFVNIIQNKGIKAILSIGGWSDTCNTPQLSTSGTISSSINSTVSTLEEEKNINTFVHNLITLQNNTNCDGFNFDWEHLSTTYSGCKNPTPTQSCPEHPDTPYLKSGINGIKASTPDRKNRLRGLYAIMYKLKTYFNTNSLKVEIGYTTRFNGYKAYGNMHSNTEATELLNCNESITIDKMPCDYINIMSYDAPCESDSTNTATFLSPLCEKDNKAFSLALWYDIMDSYKLVSSDSAVQNFLKKNTNIGFEPDPQAASGINPSNIVIQEVLQKIKKNKYGGILVWAINDKGIVTETVDDILTPTCNFVKGDESLNILKCFKQGVALPKSKGTSSGKDCVEPPICCFSKTTRYDCADKNGTTTKGVCSNDANYDCSDKKPDWCQNMNTKCKYNKTTNYGCAYSSPRGYCSKCNDGCIKKYCGSGGCDCYPEEWFQPKKK